MVTLVNSFHKTQATIRKNVGDYISAATMRRVRKQLCPVWRNCQCGHDPVSSRHSKVYIVEDSAGSYRIAEWQPWE